MPTVGETLPGYVLDPWFGAFGPRGVPAPIASRRQAEMARILRSAESRDHLASMGAEPVGNTPAEFAAHVRSEIAKYARIVKTAGVQVD